MLLYIITICPLLTSCTDSCKDIDGEYSKFDMGKVSGKDSNTLATYELNDGYIELRTSYKNGDTYDSAPTAKGNYHVEGDRVIANFGGSDRELNIDRNSNGCIESLSFFDDYSNENIFMKK